MLIVAPHLNSDAQIVNHFSRQEVGFALSVGVVFKILSTQNWQARFVNQEYRRSCSNTGKRPL